MAESMKSFVERRLSITMESELLQSFVRITVDEDEKEAQDEIKDVNALAQDNKLGESEPKSKQTVPSETSRKLSKQFGQEAKKKLKKRRRRLGPKHEELYCDKDRAAAVNMGSKDIKQSLKLKRKQDRSRHLQIPEEAEPGNFLALGNYEMCRGDLRIANDFITKALELNPVEKNALVARSKCHILLGQPRKALEDAEAALQVDKNFIKAIYQKAEALYYLGDFELSLMYYHRGLHVRPDHEGFKLGVHKSQKAIENAIGTFCGTKTNLVKTTPTLETTNGNEDDRAPSCRSKLSHKTTTTTSSNRKKSSKKTRLLRELETDKEYLDSLMHNPNIKCKFKENDNKIENCIKETMQYLNERQEFWRQQMPPNYNHE